MWCATYYWKHLDEENPMTWISETNSMISHFKTLDKFGYVLSPGNPNPRTRVFNHPIVELPT